jgi:WD40 repeat protein
MTRFASSAKWLEHMTIRHGSTWTREVHAPTSWICPFCDKDAAVFERPDDLALHLENPHPTILTEPQVQAIVRQSRLHYPRAPDICPLCSFSMSQQQDQNFNSVNKGGQASTTMGQTKHTTSNHAQAKEPSAAGSKTESSAETATHVATHLQGIMLLSLRLIPAHLKTTDPEDTQSMSSSQYNVSSITRSNQGDLDPDVASDDGLANMSDGVDQEDDPFSHIEPPDVIDEPHWDAIPRPNFQSENDDILAKIGEAIRRRVDLEPSFRTLEGHSGGLTSVAFSSDGQQLASGSNDRMIKIWNVATGQCLQTFKSHARYVESVEFSPDGQQLASGSYDETTKIWNMATGQCLRTLEGHTDVIASVAFSPDGQQIASGSHDSTIKIWNVATGQCLRTLKCYAVTVRSVAFSPDGQQLASGSFDKTPKIWNVATGQCLQTLEGHTDIIGSVAFSPDGQQLASGSHDRTIKIWNMVTGQCLQTFEGHTDIIRSVAFSSDGQQLASGSNDGTIKIWNVVTSQCLQTLEGHASSVLSAKFSPDGQKLASGSNDTTIRIWDILPSKGEVN